MPRLKKILLPVDFSGSCVIATRHAAALARHFRSEVTLLHVNELSVVHALDGPLGFGVSVRDATLTEHATRRQEALDAFGTAELDGIPVKRVMCCGDPAKVIVEHARTEKTDLVLMPTHGYGDCRRFLLGSVTAKVLHDAECPVWTCTHLADKPALDPTDIRHVMCALNFGPQSAKAIRWASEFASELGAKLTLTHAVHPTPPELPERYVATWHEEARWGADEKLHALLRESGIQASVLIVDGDAPAKALGAAAQKEGAGLLVIARSCDSGISRRLGTDAYGIICHSPCPVVTI